MTEEDERTADGGVVPSEAEEYRDKDRYSIRFSQEDVSSDDVKKDGGNSMSTKEPTPASGERLTREELESRYRNDPRFNMIFDHEIKKRKKKEQRNTEIK